MPTATKVPRWEELDEETREELDARYLKELELLAEPGLTADGVKAYLAYRHERPQAAITTYEEGQIAKMLHGMTDSSKVPDPVEEEEHTDPLEVFGARRLHVTNMTTYAVVMLAVGYVALLLLISFLIGG